MITRTPHGLVTVIGGSGFIGRHVVRELARSGWRIRVAVRRPHLAHEVRTLGAVGQIHPVQANVRHPESLLRACDGSDVVINLVGILYPSGRQRFAAVHEFGARAAARTARTVGAHTFVQFSALGADPESPSQYAATKAAGEVVAREEFPETIIIRPSIAFGPEDNFFNRFAALARISPALPLVGGGHTRFQPVFVGDIADAVAVAVRSEEAAGRTYELGGPEVFTFRELMEFVLRATDRRRLLIPVPYPVATLMAYFLQWLPRPLLTPDQVRLLRYDNVVSEAAQREQRTLEGLGVAPHGMEAIVMEYLEQYRPFGQFTQPGTEHAEHAEQAE